MKYKIIKSDILLKGIIIPENSEVDLSESDIKGIEDYLSPCHSEQAKRVEESPLSHPEPVEESLDPKKEKEPPKGHSEHSEESLNTKTEQKNKTKRGNK